MNVLETASFYRLTPECVRSWARKGKLSGKKEGGEWEFTVQHTSRQPLLIASEVAERFFVNKKTVQAWARRGSLPCIKLSTSTLRFRVEDVEHALRPKRGRP